MTGKLQILFLLKMFQYIATTLRSVKVIIHKSHGELPLVEQDTIEYVSVAYLNP